MTDVGILAVLIRQLQQASSSPPPPPQPSASTLILCRRCSHRHRSTTSTHVDSWAERRRQAGQVGQAFGPTSFGLTSEEEGCGEETAGRPSREAAGGPNWAVLLVDSRQERKQQAGQASSSSPHCAGVAPTSIEAQPQLTWTLGRRGGGKQTKSGRHLDPPHLDSSAREKGAERRQ
jgi:hypothetical protein